MILNSNLIHYYIGEKKLLLLILFGSLSITTIDLLIYESEQTYGIVAYNGCMGVSHEFQVRVDSWDENWGQLISFSVDKFATAEASNTGRGFACGNM